METKSLPEQYKHFLHVPGDVIEHILLEQIRMALILALFQHTSKHRMLSKILVRALHVNSLDYRNLLSQRGEKDGIQKVLLSNV